MKVVILTWSKAENNPFDFFSKNLAELLAQGGRQTQILDVANKNWVEKLQILKPHGVEFVLTFQGLGTNYCRDGKNIWDELKIPLVCLHGDHPSHWPDHHKLDSRYCLHLYADSEWAMYANQHFHKKFAATVAARALFPPESLDKSPEGNFFVIAKNIKPPESFEVHWKKDHPVHVANAMLGAATMLRGALQASQNHVRIHDLIDAYIDSENIQFMKPHRDGVFYHSAHSQLDFYVRNLKSVMALAEVHDLPLRVYGRGWDELSGQRSRHHSFFPGLSTEGSRELYNSRFGIIDISPAQLLHDRSRRAMANLSAFTTNAYPDNSYDENKYSTLFFTTVQGSLRSTAERIVSDPLSHQQSCAEFASLYRKRYSPLELLFRAENFARALSAA